MERIKVITILILLALSTLKLGLHPTFFLLAMGLTSTLYRFSKKLTRRKHHV